MSYKKVLQCDTAGTIAIPSKTSHGCWEFDVYKGADANRINIMLIYNRIDTIQTDEGYYLYCLNTESLGLAKSNIGSDVALFSTANSYIANNTWYRVKVARLQSAGTFAHIVPSMITEYDADTFAVFIKGGAFGNTYTLVSTTGGSGTNPVTDNTYTTSKYFVADLDSGDKMSNIKITNGVKQ